MPQLILEDEDGVIGMLRESVAAFAEGRPGPQTIRNLRAASGDIDGGLWLEMAGAGWCGLMLPEELGGAGLGIRHQAIISEALGRALIPSPLATASVLTGGLLMAAPVSDEVRRLAAGIIPGEAIVAPVLASGPGRVAPSARSEGDDIVLDGRVDFVEAAVSATDFLVVAKAGDEDVLVSLDAEAGGVQRIDRPGVDGTPVSTLVFSGARVPKARILARGDLTAAVEQAILLARVALAAELCGIASRTFELASEYTQERVQFGKPIASFQVIQHRLVDLWGEAEFACAAVVNAVERLEEGNSKAARLAVLAAKARASDAAFLIGRRAVHLYGAMGFTDECDIGLYLKRAINLGAMLGQAEELRLQFVREERAA